MTLKWIFQITKVAMNVFHVSSAHEVNVTYQRTHSLGKEKTYWRRRESPKLTSPKFKLFLIFLNIIIK